MLTRRPSFLLSRAAVVAVAAGVPLLGIAGAATAAEAPTPTATPMSTDMPMSTATPMATATPSATSSSSTSGTATAAPAPADAPKGAPDTGFGDASNSTSIPLVAAGAVALLGAVAVPVVAIQRRRGQF